MRHYPPRRESGQILLLLVLCFVPLILMVAYLFNTGEQVARKEKIQNAADAAAVSDASYAARALNVMSMDNIAISQTLGMDVIYATLLPTAVSLSEQIEPVLQTDTEEMIAGCSDYPLDIITCPPVVARFVLAVGVAGYIADFDATTPGRLIRLNRHVTGYASLSDNLVTQFPALTRQLQSDLAQANGVAPDTRVILIGATAPTAADPQHLSTGLPVIHVDVTYNALHPDVNAAVAEGLARRELYHGGLNGTQTTPGIGDYAWNYQYHGYSRQGPYAINRDDAFDQFEVVVTMAELAGFSAPTPSADANNADRCWQDATPVVIAPGYCVNGVPAGIPVSSGVYAFAPLGTPVFSAGIFDIMALAHFPRSSGPVAAMSFQSKPGDMFSLARARVYNATSADLYSADWRATLTPVVPSVGGLDLTGLGSATAPSINVLIQLIPTLNGSATNLSENDWRAFLTH